MNNINYEYIQKYINQLLPESSGILSELEEYAKINHVPIISPEVGSLLKILIKATNTKKILEIGTAIGYSSILMGMAAGEDFKITTIEKSKKMIDIAVKNIKVAGYDNNITVLEGDASEVLKSLKDNYDMIFIDAAKGQYMEFLHLSFDKLKVGGLFICDNVLFRGMVAEKSLMVRRKITIIKRLRKFLNFISSHDAMETVVIPLGDGISITFKQKEAKFDE